MEKLAAMRVRRLTDVNAHIYTGHPELVRNCNTSRKRRLVEERSTSSPFLVSPAVSQRLIRKKLIPCFLRVLF